MFYVGIVFKNGKVVIYGGRVFVVIVIWENFILVFEEVKKGLVVIKFEGVIYRKDVGFCVIVFF